MKKPVNVAITGAAGQIGYALAFRVASGAMLGPDQPINLHLLEITPALPGLQGVVMELNDCAFPTLNKVIATDDARVAFKDCDVAMLVGARPRGPGMERKDLLLANAQKQKLERQAKVRYMNETGGVAPGQASMSQPALDEAGDAQLPRMFVVGGN